MVVGSLMNEARSYHTVFMVVVSILILFLMPGCVAAINVNISVSGHPIDVWSAVATYHKCGIIDVPDIPARAYTDDNGTIHMIDGSTNFHRMTGPSIFNVSRECNVSWNETGNPDPAMMAGDEFLDSTWSFNNGTVISLLHTEYPGNVYNNCDGPSYPYCWTVTIGLAISNDWGKTWQHSRPPPHHLVAAVPYKYNQTQLAYGWGDPSNIVQHPKDGYYYVAMWNRNQVGLQEPGICIARTNNLLNPSSWRGWNGTDFDVSFVSAYNEVDPSKHICKVTNLPLPNCAPAGLSWSVYLNTFVVTLGCSGGKSGRGFYVATSDDLIHWSDAPKFYSRDDMPADVQKVVTNLNYPVFLDPTAPLKLDDSNYYKIGQNPYLYWASIGHSPHTDGRHLWATPMHFT